MHLPPPHALSERNWPSWLPSFSSGNPDDPNGGDKDLQNWSSLIGIVTAICGNVLIALALNVQRYAHIRLHRHKALVRERARQALKNAQQRQGQGGGIGGYGAAGTSTTNGHSTQEDEDGHESSETDPLTQSFRSDDSRWTLGSDSEDSPKIVSSYLQDPYWWLGQVLITVGEMGNFLAYGFAPASIVSPLGVVALVSNCVIAPIFFKEVFRVRDFWGVIVAIGGAVTVVLSAKTEETKLGPHEVWDAITTMEFEIYMGISISLIVLLMYLSPRYGNRTIFIDLGLVGLFGGYTALSTKGVSSMLSSTLLGAFKTPVTYVLLLILLSTAIMQVRFLNKALQRFDSTQVIPIQFVLFTLSVIIGSAVLYGDFERTNLEQATKFVGGCLLTFFGVFLITSGRPPHDEEDEGTLSDAEGIEETIGLANQDRATARGVGTPEPPRRGSNSTTAGRPRRSSRVSFKEGMNSKLSLKVPQKGDFINEEDDDHHDDAPLLGGPWRDSTVLVHPGLGVHTISSESVPSTVISDTPTERYDHTTLISVTAATPESPCTPPQPPTILTTNASNRPMTPAARLAHLTGGGPVISPSPFSSTLTAVVTDTFLSHLDPTSSPSQVRSRPSLRNSFFIPQEGSSDFESQHRGAISAVERRFDHHGHHGLFGGYLDGRTEDNHGFRGRGIRGRARSLSHTLGGLFGVGSGSSRPVVVRDRDNRQQDDGGQLQRARTTGSGSTETL